MFQLILPFLHKSVVSKRNTASLTAHLLVVLPHLRLPALLGPEVILGLEAQDLHGGDVEVHQDVLEGRPVAGLGGPALLDQQFEALRTAGGQGQLEGVGADTPDDGRAVHVLVRQLPREELPHADSEAPDVDLLIARLVPDHLRGHPRHRPGEAHQGAVLRPLAGGAEVADLDDVTVTNQDTVGNIISITSGIS